MPQTESVSDLQSIGGAAPGTHGVGARPVPADDLHAAEWFLRTITLTARTFVRRVVDGAGGADAEELRNEFGSLRGPTVALARGL